MPVAVSLHVANNSIKIATARPQARVQKLWQAKSTTVLHDAEDWPQVCQQLATESSWVAFDRAVLQGAPVDSGGGMVARYHRDLSTSVVHVAYLAEEPR